MSAILRMAPAVLLLVILPTTMAHAQGTSCSPQALRTAAARGDLAAVNACLKSRPSVDAANSDGLTALMMAAANGHREVVVALITAGADVNYATPRDGLTALLMAAHWGHLSTVETLVEKGANVLHKDRGDRNAVDWASGYADGRKDEAIATARYLMSKGTPLVQRGGSALFAAVGGKPDIEAMVSKEGGAPPARGQSTPPSQSRASSASAHQPEPTLAILFVEKRDGSAVDLRIIALATQAQADQVLMRLAKGETFAKVAEETSVHSTRSAGGYLGHFELAHLREDFRVALEGIPVSGHTKVLPFKLK
jgi:ankyrin repeat protein